MAKSPKYKYVSTRQRDFKCGEVYHLFQRSNHEAKVFISDVERGIYLNRMFMLCKRHSVRVHNFVLMGNHIHFVVDQLRVGAISKLMHDLQGPHARAHNKLVGQKGNLWTQHYGCKQHVDTAQYYRTLMHYVEKNPVKIGQSKRAEDYEWSGARAHAANGPVTIRVDKTLTVKVDLYLKRWREECEDQRKMGWSEYLDKTEIDKEAKAEIEMILDGISRQRFANREKVKRLAAERKRKREYEELEKKFGPAQAKQMQRAADLAAKQAAAEAKAGERRLGAG